MKTNFVTEPAESSRINEDTIFCDNVNHVYAIFDGATSLSGFKDKNGYSGGYIAANIAKQMCKDFRGKTDTDLLNLLLTVNSELKKQMITNSIDINNKTELWSTTAAIVKIQDGWVNWAQISDSIILMIYKNRTYKTFGEKRNHDQGLMLLLKDLKHRPVDNAKEVIMKYVFDLRNRSNIDYGFLNGEPEATKFIAHGKVKLSELSDIVLFSDGLIPLVNDPEFDPQYDEFITIYKQSGVKGVKDWIRNLENSDPDCNSFIRNKAHDDISIIGIVLNS